MALANIAILRADNSSQYQLEFSTSYDDLQTLPCNCVKSVSQSSFFNETISLRKIRFENNPSGGSQIFAKVKSENDSGHFLIEIPSTILISQKTPTYIIPYMHLIPSDLLADFLNPPQAFIRSAKKESGLAKKDPM